MTTKPFTLKRHLLGLLVLGLSQQALAQTLDTPHFTLELDDKAQTLISMQPKGAGGFDFLPAAHSRAHSGPGYYRLGDIDLRLRIAGKGAWQDYSSALTSHGVNVLSAKGKVLAASDISADLQGIPLKVERDWLVEKGALVLRFRLTNPTAQRIEIGGLGIPMVFDNVITGRTLDQAHEQASFTEPYMGMDAGYVQVTRLNGKGPTLLVVPEQQAPLENWMPLLDKTQPDGKPLIFNDPTHRTTTFEGFYDWMVLSKGFSDTEWQGVKQWNRPTAKWLAPGASMETAVRFVLSPSIKGIEATLKAQQRPVAVGIPGYVVPTDLPADLFLDTPSAITSMTVAPKGALVVSQGADKGDWHHFKVAGKKWGRARLTVHYQDGSEQSIHYFVTDPMATAVSKMGHFLYNQQWYQGKNDPFGRGPSVMGYDNQAKHIILQDSRVWIAGLSDEGGAGPWLAAIMKELGQPNAGEVAKFEQFYTQVLDGNLQYASGPYKYGVKKSLFYYDPKALPNFQYDKNLDWSSWTSWNKKDAASPERSFNYPHVAAAQWVLYRLARFHQGLVKAHPWRWYLNQAYHTTMAMMTLAPYYTQFGQMEGDVFVAILKDLRHEGMNSEADKLQAVMKKRADHWASMKYPFGSEMPWDSTGQEEVYAWMRYFGDTQQADETRDVILGYDLTQPHWGYNGSARRFWDFLYAGKFSRIERQLHHYGSTINALPLLDSYRRNPASLYLLRVGYGGMMGSLTNIDQKGFASAAFHSFPDMLKFDPYSGDYGSNFFGQAYGIGSYLVKDAQLGWLGFGGEVTTAADGITLLPKDDFKTRVYIAPLKLYLTLDAGTFKAVQYRTDGTVLVTFNGPDAQTPHAALNIHAYGPLYQPSRPLNTLAGRYQVPLKQGSNTLLLRPKKL
ncbi:DUF5695 domain-containing protein [Gallaecimonas mangrovi]|uniref:DUF5695 domain-containing protein n=1 Tax=Gallaecimonas mangrovi TaxID=2291597 RepID=UPI000E1FCCD3|nr:DUF5695 domain-containing protein [Gallaecimonas mangrovi]